MAKMAARAAASGRERSRDWRNAAIAGVMLAAIVAAGRGWPRAGDVVPGPVPARVVAVIDGDTITVRARIWLGQDASASMTPVGTL